MSTMGPIFIICELVLLGYVGWCCNEAAGNGTVIGRYILICVVCILFGLTLGIIVVTGE